MGIDASYNSQEWGGSDVKHRGICPSGWHIPSDAEWSSLTSFVESDKGCSFSTAGSYGYWWSATEYLASNAYSRYMYYSSAIVDYYNDVKTYFFSVRCVQD